MFAQIVSACVKDLICAAVISVAVASPLGAPLAFAGEEEILPKEQMYRDMIAMAYQMRDLSPQIASSEAAAALYEQLQTAYKRMSDALGGDDPGRALPTDKRRDVGMTQTRAAPPQSPPPEGGIAGTFATPPGCAASPLSLFANATDFPINNSSTIASSVTVSGLTGRIWYIEPRLDTLHTANADLDIFLTSPSGTTVTLSTDNGGTFDNVFHSTVFVDDADPDGQVPYVTNNGLVTDHLYQNGVAANPLVPEEPLHAFAGEDPNGSWTLSVTDDSIPDTGTLLGWDMFVITVHDPTSRTTRTFTNNTAGGLTDNGLTVRDINVSGMGGFLCDVQVRVDIPHVNNEDLDISLTSPSGKVITLTTDNGLNFDNGFAGTTFDDAADRSASGANTPTDGAYANLARNVLTPEESFASLRGTDANGTWSLRISDDTAGNFGAFNSVSLILTTCSCEPACPGDLNGDGLTNVDDLLGVISGWGACP